MNFPPSLLARLVVLLFLRTNPPPFISLCSPSLSSLLSTFLTLSRFPVSQLVDPWHLWETAVASLHGLLVSFWRFCFSSCNVCLVSSLHFSFFFSIMHTRLRLPTTTHYARPLIRAVAAQKDAKQKKNTKTRNNETTRSIVIAHAHLRTQAPLFSLSTVHI